MKRSMRRARRWSTHWDRRNHYSAPGFDLSEALPFPAPTGCLKPVESPTNFPDEADFSRLEALSRRCEESSKRIHGGPPVLNKKCLATARYRLGILPPASWRAVCGLGEISLGPTAFVSYRAACDWRSAWKFGPFNLPWRRRSAYPLERKASHRSVDSDGR